MKALTLSYSESRSAPPARKLVDLPIPEPRAGEVRVRVHYAGLNYIDLETSNGEHRRAVERALKRSPVVSGIEMAGIAETDGQRINRGDPVFGYTHITRGPFYHAQAVSTPESHLAVVPANMSLEGAASIVGGALTSINALERIAHLERGARVLVTAATGSVGTAALQLSRYLGAEVSAVCHSSQRDFAMSLGASSAFAYDNQELPKPEGQFDVVFDAAPSLSFTLAQPFLRADGLYVSTMPHRDVIGWVRSLFSRRRWGFLLEHDTDATRMERLRALIVADAFSPTIDSIFPLKDAEEAFARQAMSGKRGKILLDFRDIG